MNFHDMPTVDQSVRFTYYLLWLIWLHHRMTGKITNNSTENYTFFRKNRGLFTINPDSLSSVSCYRYQAKGNWKV